MRIFISAGEPSGDLHGANLIRALRQRQPDVEVVGFGGDQMATAGCLILFPLVQLAVMWLLRVLANLHRFLGVISLADRWFRHHRPDAVVLIDYPGLHWWLARRAKFHGIPVFYFVPPQIWAWAGWRVNKMRRFVDHVLCSLPFEKDWYAARGVPAHYVGHPYFDALDRQRLDRGFIERQHGGPVVALLPGSRHQEVEKNFPMICRAAEIIHRRLPQVRFLTANFNEPQRRYCADSLANRPLPVELHVGRTAEIIQLADACIAVSGSVSLELLYAARPSVVVYRVGSLALRLTRRYLASRYITLVNLLADRELFPEYLTDRCAALPIADRIVGWLTDPACRAELVRDLVQLRDAVGRPGACARAADYLLDVLKGRRHARAA